MDLNKVMLIGRLTRDPETRTTPQGQSVCTFSIATGFQWKDQAGNKQERTEFHNVVAWRKLADICAQYLRKGKQIYVEGRLQTRSWDDPSGTKKYKTEVIMDNMIMLGSAGDGKGAGAPMGASPKPSSEPTPTDLPAHDPNEIRVDDIPF